MVVRRHGGPDKRPRKLKGSKGPRKRKGRVGQHPIQIDWQRVHYYARMQASEAEIAAKIGVHLDTLEKACKDQFKVKLSEVCFDARHNGRSALRRFMWLAAKRGSVKMMIHLSKQKGWLGMSDKITHSVSGEDIPEGQTSFPIRIRILEDETKDPPKPS